MTSIRQNPQRKQSRLCYHDKKMKRCVLCLIAETYQFFLMHLQYTTDNYNHWCHLADVLAALNAVLMAKNDILYSIPLEPCYNVNHEASEDPKCNLCEGPAYIYIYIYTHTNMHT